MELKHFEDKVNILRAKGKLINRKGEAIYIDCDLTRKEQETQKRLRDIATEEKKKGKIVKKGYNFLVINNEKWKWNSKANNITRQIEVDPKN